MEPKFIFVGDLKKCVEKDADANIYGVKLWRVYQEIIRLLSIKFKPTLEFEFDIISNYKKYGATYGVYPIINHENFDYGRFCREVVIAIDTCIKFGLLDNENYEKHYMLQKIYQILDDFDVETLDEDEDKKFIRIEKSLLRFAGRYAKKYKVEISIVNNEEDHQENGVQLDLIDATGTDSYVLKKEKSFNLNDSFMGKIKSLSLMEGYPSIIFSLEDPKVEIKAHFDLFCQDLILGDGLFYKNKELKFKVKSDKDAKVITVTIIE